MPWQLPSLQLDCYPMEGPSSTSIPAILHDYLLYLLFKYLLAETIAALLCDKLLQHLRDHGLPSDEQHWLCITKMLLQLTAASFSGGCEQSSGASQPSGRPVSGLQRRG